jgi:3,4-dihydroxy 2-butanone 4-phosphate synthase/GTP cyclohydrolase II
LRDVIGVRGESRAWTLRAAMARVAQSASGVVVILRPGESPRELADAVRHPGRNQQRREPAAESSGAVLRTYGIGAQILQELGVRRMRVLSAPRQLHGISAFGLEIVDYIDESGNV